MSGIVGSKVNHRGSGLVAKLGTDGQVFTSSGAGVSQAFEAAAGGGAWEYITGDSFSDVSGFIADLGATIYPTHMLQVRCVRTDDDGNADSLRLRFREDDDTLIDGNVYNYNAVGLNSASATWSGVENAEQTSYIILTVNGIRHDIVGTTTIEMHGLQIAEYNKDISSVDIRPNQDAAYRYITTFGSGSLYDNTILGSISFYCDGSNITGSYRLYGLVSS